jgi:hypothetical protein
LLMGDGMGSWWGFDLAGLVTASKGAIVTQNP